MYQVVCIKSEFRGVVKLLQALAYIRRPQQHLIFKNQKVAAALSVCSKENVHTGDTFHNKINDLQSNKPEKNTQLYSIFFSYCILFTFLTETWICKKNKKITPAFQGISMNCGRIVIYGSTLISVDKVRRTSFLSISCPSQRYSNTEVQHHSRHAKC